MRRVQIGLVAAGCLLPWFLGCCSVDRHGVILRGVCSLELNRVPWLGCAEPVCGEEAPSCGVVTPPGGHGEAVPAPAITEADHVYSRFHPVPTRPVFWPRPAPSPPIPGGPFPQSPWGTPPPNQVSSFQKDKPPAPIKLEAPEPPEEELPQAPLPPGDREVHVPRRLGMASGSRNWMFPTLGFLPRWRAALGQAHRGSDGGRVVR